MKETTLCPFVDRLSWIDWFSCLHQHRDRIESLAKAVRLLGIQYNNFPYIPTHRSYEELWHRRGQPSNTDFLFHKNEDLSLFHHCMIHIHIQLANSTQYALLESKSHCIQNRKFRASLLPLDHSQHAYCRQYKNYCRLWLEGNLASTLAMEPCIGHSCTRVLANQEHDHFLYNVKHIQKDCFYTADDPPPFLVSTGILLNTILLRWVLRLSMEKPKETTM
mmetsp:Transcript_9134/g.14175  ORF Transcript_9134/g.14175 Transcript_9134/m.14175 type:complete len:220 (+) Transcript_9134:284-943(+)